MRYDRDEALRELQIRSARMREEQRRRAITGLSGASAMLAGLLAVVIELVVPTLATTTPMVAYGAFLLPGEAGGYVLAAVVAFVLGVFFALGCVRWQHGVSHRELSRLIHNGELVEGVEKDGNHV